MHQMNYTQDILLTHPKHLSRALQTCSAPGHTDALNPLDEPFLPRTQLQPDQTSLFGLDLRSEPDSHSFILMFSQETHLYYKNAAIWAQLNLNCFAQHPQLSAADFSHTRVSTPPFNLKLVLKTALQNIHVQLACFKQKSRAISLSKSICLYRSSIFLAPVMTEALLCEPAFRRANRYAPKEQITTFPEY